MSRRRDLDLQLPAALRPLGPFVPALAIIVLQLAVFPVGIGTWILGVVFGMLTALIALGLALIYRSNRILNFAQAELGTVPVTLTVGIIVVSGLPYLFGIVVGLAASILLGAVVELAVIRRFFRAPRLLLTVATIGLSQLLIVCGLLLPRMWPEDKRVLFLKGTIPQPFDARWEIGTQVFRGADILAMVIAPLILLGLVLFLRGTDVGVALRASADRTDRAALLGIPVRWLQTGVWSLAGALSFIGVFLQLSLLDSANAGALSAGALVFALSALLIGRLENLAAVTATAIALRVLDQGVSAKYPSDVARVYLVLAVVLLVVLALRRVSTRRRDVDGTTLQAADEIRPIPAELRRLPLVRWLRVLIPVVLVGAAAALPLVLRPSQELKASTVAVYALIALSVVVLTGWAGQVSLGQMAFVAVGGAVGAVATVTWEVDLIVALLAAGTAGAVVAVIVGLPALRQPGLYLAVTTLTFSLACGNFLLNRKEQAWIPQDAVSARPLFRRFDLSSEAAMYELVLGVVVLAFLAVAGIRRSRTGRAIIAVRDNERGAAAYAIPVVRAKLTAFALSGFLAAVAGCLLVHVNRGYDEFAAGDSLGVFTAAVVGGLGSLAGAVLGALYLNGGEWFLEAPWNLLPSAVGVLLVLMILPGGLANLLYRGRDALLRRLALRRGIVVASLVADTAGDEAPDAIKVAMPDRPVGLDGALVDEPVGTQR